MNLVQIQMAYLAYYKIQDLLGPAADQTSKEDAIAYAGELTTNVGKIMASFQGILRESKDQPRTPNSKGPEHSAAKPRKSVKPAAEQ